MVTCPRCQQPVDETVRSACPLCFTPIVQPGHGSGSLASTSLDGHLPLTGSLLDSQAQPPEPAVISSPIESPGPPEPVTTGNRPPLPSGARISLTGEVIEAAAPSRTAHEYTAGSNIASGRQTPLSPAERARSLDRRRDEKPKEDGGGRGIAYAAIAAVVLLSAGGGLYWWMHRTNPKDQALAVYRAYLSQDFRAAYALSAFSPDTLKLYPNADVFAAEQSKVVDAALSNPTVAPIKSAILDSVKKAADSAVVGDPTVTGNRADVPTSTSLSLMGQTVNFKGAAHMVNDFGIWKLDLMTDSGSAPTQAGRDLMGHAELSGLIGR